MDMLKDMEKYFCDSLGFGEHQRASVVHGDTNNLHIHLAINKIHPQTLKFHDPFQDKRRMQQMCRSMEARHSLAPNPNAKEQGHVMDSYGFKSFESWLKETAKPDLMEALELSGSWQELQAAAARFDVEFRKSGSGLAISHRSQKLFVKASSVDRSFSFKKLEAKLGRFEPSQLRGIEPAVSYQKAPNSRDSSDLYSEYLAYQNGLKSLRKEQLDFIKSDKDERLQRLKGRYRDKRIALNISRSLAWNRKKSERSTLAAEFVFNRKALSRDIADARKKVYEGTKILGWPDWLQEKSSKGDTLALDALQKSKRRSTPKKDEGFICGSRQEGHLPAEVRYEVRRNGDVHYRVGDTVVIDQGNGVRVHKDAAQEAIDFAITLSQKRFGAKLKVSGEKDICSRIEKEIKSRGRGFEL